MQYIRCITIYVYEKSKNQNKMKKIRLFTFVAFAIGLVSCGTNRDVMTGAYDKSKKLDVEADSIFRVAVLSQKELNLKPLKVSRQVVAGMNYRFTCIDSNKKKVEVVVYEPLPGQGKAHITSVNGLEYK